MANKIIKETKTQETSILKVKVFKETYERFERLNDALNKSGNAIDTDALIRGVCAKIEAHLAKIAEPISIKEV